MERGTLLAQRYRIDAQVGEGGMGVVYKAHDTLLDRVVAIKTLSPPLLGEEGLKRLLREAQSAAKLTHPNIVAIHDVIDEGTARLIVMEHIEGRTLRDILPLPWRKAVDIAMQVCTALEYAHDRGVVHRDIKPENIIITADATAKVMDFGLARSEGRSRLTQTGMLVGTVAYMAPEQALQGTADARSDLYALGCVLYELITGHPPFEAEDAIAIITQHINIPPVAPRFHTPDVPPALEAGILRLLAKDPADRYRSAQDVSAALKSVRSASVKIPEPQEKLAGTELVQAVRRGILVGHDGEMQLLKTLLDGAVSGEGRLVLISGQAGIGKTRLIEELITYAHLRGMRVLSAKCYAGQTPYEPCSRMLREYLRISPAEEVREALGDYASDLARLAPEVRQKLRTLPESIPLPPEQERARLFESITRLLVTLSRSSPLLLFVDDLHLADHATVQLLRYLASAIAGERVLLIVAYQSDEIDRKPEVAEAVRYLRRERFATTVEVKPLTLPEVGELIKAMAKHPMVPVKFASRIFDVTEGNPYFIEEVINTLFDQGTLYIKDGQWSTDFDEGGRYADMPVPATVRGAIDTRLERLNEDCRQVLTHGAVLGKQFRLDELAQVSGKSEDELLDLLDQALAARLLREVRVGGEDRYEFAQSMIREVIYEGISRHRRRRMHLRAAEALEQAYETVRSERAGELADHLLEAGEDERAIPVLVAAGQQAEDVFAHEEAIRRYETARELLEDAGKSEEAVRLLERLGEPYLNSGEAQKAIASYQRALEHCEAQQDRHRVAALRQKMGHAYQISWDFTTAIPLLEQSLREMGEETSREALMLYLDLARAYNFSGDAERGKLWAERALAVAESLGAVDEAAMARADLALALQFLRQFQDSERQYQEAIRLVHNRQTYLANFVHGRSINNLGVLQETRGDFRTGLEARLKALQLAEQARDPARIIFTSLNVGLDLWLLGDWKTARTHYNRAASMAERVSTPYTSNIPGVLQLLDENWEGALARWQEVTEDARRRRELQMVLIGLVLSADLALILGRLEDAERYAREASPMKQLYSHKYPLTLLAEVLARQGRADDAAAVIEQAEADERAAGATGRLASVHHVRGLIAAARGDKDETRRHFERTLAIYEEFPYPLEQARVYEDLGILNAGHDHARAAEAYTKAVAIYERIGAQRSAARARQSLSTLEAAAAP